MMKHLQQVLTVTDPLLELLDKAEDHFIGYAYDIDYGHLSFLTNDAWKERVNGIPHNAFLLASALNPALGSGDELDREVLLLRVLAPQPLPQAGEMIKTRIEHHQRRTRAQQLPEARPPAGTDPETHDGIDWLTRSELQASGLRCRIIGTFYMEGDELRLGSDIENYMAMSPLRIYRPCPQALETIVNHVNAEVRAKAEKEARDAGFARAPSPIVIGNVRYTSTRRLQMRQTREVEVRIAPSDFLARRTAILGMTRTGKSNTVKTTVAAVTLAAMADEVKIGQLIFDLNGEYANATHQDDGSSIAEVFPEETVRYRAMDTAGFEDLRLNFYEDPASAVQLMGQLYEASTGISAAQDVKQFFGLDLSDVDPSNMSAKKRLHNQRVTFSLVLKEAAFPGGPSSFKMPVGKKLVDGVRQARLLPDPADLNDRDAARQETALQAALAASDSQGYTNMNGAMAREWMVRVRSANLTLKNGIKGARSGEWELTPNGIGLISSSGEAWVDKSLEVLLNMLAGQNSGGTGIFGSRALTEYKPYHSSRRGAKLEPEILLADIIGAGR